MFAGSISIVYELKWLKDEVREKRPTKWVCRGERTNYLAKYTRWKDTRLSCRQTCSDYQIELPSWTAKSKGTEIDLITTRLICNADLLSISRVSTAASDTYSRTRR